jgi:hypothetical protein
VEEPNADVLEEEGFEREEPNAEDDEPPKPEKAFAVGGAGAGEATLAGVPAMLRSPLVPAPPAALETAAALLPIIPSYAPAPSFVFSTSQLAKIPSLV